MFNKHKLLFVLGFFLSSSIQAMDYTKAFDQFNSLTAEMLTNPEALDNKSVLDLQKILVDINLLRKKENNPTLFDDLFVKVRHIFWNRIAKDATKIGSTSKPSAAPAPTIPREPSVSHLSTTIDGQEHQIFDWSDKVVTQLEVECCFQAIKNGAAIYEFSISNHDGQATQELDKKLKTLHIDKFSIASLRSLLNERGLLDEEGAVKLAELIRFPTGALSVIDNVAEVTDDIQKLFANKAFYEKGLEQLNILADTIEQMQKPGPYTHVFVLGTMRLKGDGGGHFFTVVFHKTAENKMQWYIADSNKDLTSGRAAFQELKFNLIFNLIKVLQKTEADTIRTFVELLKDIPFRTRGALFLSFD